MSPYTSVAVNVGSTVAAFESVVAETTLPAKSQVTAAQAVKVAGWLPRPPVLQVVDRYTSPVGYPLVGSKPVTYACSLIPPHEWPRMAKARDCGNSRFGGFWIKSR